MSKAFIALKQQCLREGRLFEDHEFPATHSSLYYSKVIPSIQWKRPQEIVSHPVFQTEGTSRFDLDQGALGNCWYIAAAATVACKPELFARVVPRDQRFDKDYAGIFRFNFWRYGKWVEVTVDDRLPTRHGRLVYCRNRHHANEFWSALLEKAYAKLHGTYEALDGGWTEDALVDMTGGIGERIDLTNKKALPKQFFDILLHIYKMNSLMGSSIMASKETMENRLSNGLVIGHAYSVTAMVRANIKGNMVELMRLRNPWGRKEWNGAWSDGSKEWQSVPDDMKRQIGLTIVEDGEFWMSYTDWVSNFQQLQICHLPPDSPLAKDKNGWRAQVHHGSWVKGVSAGGSGQPPYEAEYWTNPQFKVKLTEPDGFWSDGKCTLIVSLIQKYGRLLRSYLKVEMANVPIGFDLYKVRKDAEEPLDGQNYEERALLFERNVDKYTWCREVTKRFRLDPGLYIVIPSIFQANVQADFILRMFTEGQASSNEMDVATGPIMQPKIRGDTLKDLFAKYGGRDGVVDARELCLILNEAFVKELGQQHQFNLEACRSLLAMYDRDQSGVLEYEELKKMWTEMKTWQGTFNSFDKDKSGYVEIKELKSIFSSIGYALSRKVLSSIVRRYGGKEGRLAFNDFLVVVSKVVVMLDLFASYSKSGFGGTAELTLDDWMQVVMYF